MNSIIGNSTSWLDTLKMRGEFIHIDKNDFYEFLDYNSTICILNDNIGTIINKYVEKYGNYNKKVVFKRYLLEILYEEYKSEARYK